jgi:hypothetical protein
VTTTHTFTETHTHAAVLVEVDGAAIEALMPELAATSEVAAGVAGLIERAVVNALDEALERAGRSRIRRSGRSPIAVVFRRDRDQSLIRFRDGEGADELDYDRGRKAVEVFHYGRAVSKQTTD